MPEEPKNDSSSEYAKAKDLVVKIIFEKDNTPEGMMRKMQVQEILSQLILLGQKRGRTSKKREIQNEVA